MSKLTHAEKPCILNLSLEIILLIIDAIHSSSTLINLACCCTWLRDAVLPVLWHTIKFDCQGLSVSGRFSPYVSAYPGFIGDEKSRLSCIEHQCAHCDSDDNLLANLKIAQSKRHFSWSLQLLSVMYRQQSPCLRYIKNLRVHVCHKFVSLFSDLGQRKLLVREGEYFVGGNLLLNGQRYFWLPGIVQDMLLDGHLRDQIQVQIFSSPSNLLPYLNAKKISTQLLKTFTNPMQLFLKCDMDIELMEIIRLGFAPFVHTLKIGIDRTKVSVLAQALKTMPNISYLSIQLYAEPPRQEDQTTEEMNSRTEPINRDSSRAMSFHMEQELFQAISNLPNLQTFSSDSLRHLALLEINRPKRNSVDTVFLTRLDPSEVDLNVTFPVTDKVSRLSVRFKAFTTFLSNDFAIRVARQFGWLTHLNVQFNEFDVGVDPNIVCSLIENNPNLKWVSMEICNDSIIACLAKSCPNLTTLALGIQIPVTYWHDGSPDRNKQITSKGMYSLAEHAFNLRHLFLHFFPFDVSLKSLLALPDCITSLEQLIVQQYDVVRFTIASELPGSEMQFNVEGSINGSPHVMLNRALIEHPPPLGPLFSDIEVRDPTLFTQIKHSDDVFYSMYNNASWQRSLLLFKINIARARELMQEKGKAPNGPTKFALKQLKNHKR